jgi:N-acetyl sugar amidotransferase
MKAEFEHREKMAATRVRYQVCAKTVMDTTDPDITFDVNGVCNYWYQWQALQKTMPSAHERRRKLAATVAKMKRRGKGRPYDCILGLSGGVDSSYLAHLIKEHGLRPFVIHFDNGWNNELAVSNIERMVKALGYDLHTFVMDWAEFRDLQRAYFKASVLDLEVPTDHMIFGALYKMAAQHRIKYIISGNNIATEWLLPKEWWYNKFDLVNMQAIHRRFGEGKLTKLPALGIWHHAFYTLVLGIVDVKLLDLLPKYNKAKAKQLLMARYGWRDYGGKHYESIFTRFYQGYILPRKFEIDKRKAHLSNLILSGQMTREQALAELQQPTYDERLQEQDKSYVAKKLGFSGEEFEQVLKLPNVSHAKYGSDAEQRRLYFKMMATLKPLTRMVKRLRA